MKRIARFVILSFFATIILTGTCTAQEANVVRVSGANLFSDEFDRLSQAFQKTNDSCKLTMVGTSTGKGIAQFINGESVLVMASRALNEKERQQATEKGMRVLEKPVGKTCLAVVTNAKNPVDVCCLWNSYAKYSLVN